MQVKQFINADFTSNTYLLYDEAIKDVILIDIGEYERLKSHLNSFQQVKALLLTHAHYDHIFYINELLADYPDCTIYGSSYTIESLASPKLNLSFYHDLPISYRGNNTRDLKGIDHLSISEELQVSVLETPGHNPGCLSFLIDDLFFTGDSYIPGHPVVTKLKGGDKVANEKSLSLIKETLTEGMTLCPGHGPMYQGHEILNQFQPSHL